MAHPSVSAAPAVFEEVDDFLRASRFMERGAVFTDLDGTAVHEVEGRVFAPPEVERGLERIHAVGRQVVVNTLRFPLSVMRAFGGAWLRATGAPIPLVALKGSQIGHVVAADSGTLGFDEIAAWPLTPDELAEVMAGIEALVERGADDLLVFFYPRDWTEGEHVWTPRPERMAHVAAKYRSASEVFSGPVTELRDRLYAADVLMVFLLEDAPDDPLMAYQHTERTRFVTHAGVDKRHGTEAIALSLDVDLAHSVGAGDAETDTFLGAVGLAAIVGNPNLDFKGLHSTLRLPDPLAWGRVLYQLGHVPPA